MSCEYYERLMNRLLDEGLSDGEEAELREHVRACPDCARLFAVFSQMTVVLREDTAEPPADFSRSVMARVAAGEPEEMPAEAPEEDGPAKGKADKKRPLPLRPWMGWTVAACLVLAVGGAALRGLQMGSSGASDAAEARSADINLVMPQAAAGADMDGGIPMEAAMDEAAEAEEEFDVEDTLEETVDFSARASSSGAELPEGALPIYDVAGNPVGTVSEENLEAFTALLTDAGWGKADPPAADWDYLFKVNFQSTTYAFGVSGDILVWWDVSGQKVARSPGTPDDLRELIDVIAPFWPE